MVAPGVGKEAGKPAHNRVEAAQRRQGKEWSTTSHTRAERNVTRETREELQKIDAGWEWVDHMQIGRHTIAAMPMPRLASPSLQLWRCACLHIQRMRHRDCQGQDEVPHVYLSTYLCTSTCKTTPPFPSSWIASAMDHHSGRGVGSDRSCCACCARRWRAPRGKGHVVDAGRCRWC